MSIQVAKKRKEIQKTIKDNLITNYNEKNIVFYECPTGSGKTNILLECAYRLLNEKDTCVIISTNSNHLALNYFSAQTVDDLKKYSGITIDPDEIEIMLGRSNFIDKNAVFTLIEENDEFKQKVTFENATKWFSNKENKQLVEKFLEDFELSKEYGDILCMTEKSIVANIEEKNLNEEDIDNAMSKKVTSFKNGTITIKNFPHFLYEEKKIFITNHLYLLTLVELLSKEHDLKNIPMLLDEAQDVSKLAQLRYTVSFSAFRLFYLAKLIQEAAPSKDSNEMVDRCKVLHEKTKLAEGMLPKDVGFYFEKIKDFVASFEQKKLNKLLRKIKKNQKEEKTDYMLERNIFFLKKEYFELQQCANVKTEKLNINFSGEKGYFSCKTLKKEPKFELRRHFWKNVGNCTLLSGTHRTDANFKNSIEKNKWAMNRVGLIRYSDEETEEKGEFYMQEFNERLKNNIKLKTFDWIFDKNNFVYFLIKDKSLDYREFKEESHGLNAKPNYQNFAKNISIFYSYYKPDFFVKQNTLILTTSFDATSSLEEELIGAGVSKDKIFTATKEHSAISVLNKYSYAANSKRGNILIGALPFWTGIDLKGELCTSIIITKLPYELPTLSNKKNYNGYINKMILLFRQGVGRGSRSENDKVALFVFDSKAKFRENSKAYAFLDEMGKELNFDSKFKKEIGDFNEAIQV